MKHRRLLGLLLSAAMALSLFPAITPPALAGAGDAGKYVTVTLGGGDIGNGGHSPTNLFYNFGAGTNGFSYSHTSKTELSGNHFTMHRPKTSGTFTVNLRSDNNNPVLYQLAQSPTAQYKVSGWIQSCDDDLHVGKLHDDCDRVQLWLNGSMKDYSGKDDDEEDTRVNVDYGWTSMYGLSEIKIELKCVHWCEGWDYDEDEGNEKDTHAEIELLIRDNSGPSLSGFSSSTNASTNSRGNLTVKLGVKDANDPDNYYYSPTEYETNANAKNSREWVQTTVTFNKAVTMASLNASGGLLGVDGGEYNNLAIHQLFTNTSGTGIPGAGMTRSMELQTSQGNMAAFSKSLVYKYTATYGDSTGNNAIANQGYIVSGAAGRTALLDRIRNAGFHDAAGNPLSVSNSVVNSSNNIFAKGVIVDAVPPTYTRVGNGITPDILTGMVLNKNDQIPFIVEFSEAVQVKQGYDQSKTYLLLNNGGRAYYTGKSGNAKQWYFTYTVSGETAQDASMLKAIALTNDALDGRLSNATGSISGRPHLSARSFNVDARVITDYTGNVMVDRANESAKTNTKQIQSSIDFARETVDNTPPSITLRHTVYGTDSTQATDLNWGQGSKVSLAASDPNVQVPRYDPEYTSGNTSKPSKGIFRPDASAGVEASAVGLIFYTWSRSVEPPAVGDNYEAIKRFSLAAVQPADAGRSYSSSWNGLTLRMTNNYSEVQPPDEALSGESDGAWYLHVWTADMTWDSARQLMQYQLSKNLQYKSGYDERAALQRKAELMSQYPTLSYDEAWAKVRDQFLTDVYTSEFIGWLDEAVTNGVAADKYSDDAKIYAQSQALLQNAAYTDLSRWGWDKFNQDDSNWVYSFDPGQGDRHGFRVLLDNTPPEDPVYNLDAITGQNTASVRIPVTLSDSTSGLNADKVYYQWVKKGKGYTDVDWSKVNATGEAITNTLNDGLADPNFGVKNISFIADTTSLVSEDGEYQLYVMCQDMAGNVSIIGSGDLTAIVNSSNPIRFAYGPAEAVDGYQQNVTPTVEVTGVEVDKLYWAVTDSVSLPDEAQFQEAAAPVNGVYTIPALNKDTGIWYLHVKVVQAVVGSTTDYSWQPYRIDTDAPAIHLNPNGSSTVQSVGVTAQDGLAGVDRSKFRYQLSESADAIPANDTNWQTVPSSGRVDLEEGEWYLHVMAQDYVGNEAYVVSEPYTVTVEHEEVVYEWPMDVEYGCQLLTIEEGYGIAHLTLEDAVNENLDMAGYRYSVTTDGGATWCDWLPYQSIIRMDLPSRYSDTDLWVKFRSPEGAVGGECQIEVSPVAEPVWATMSFDSLLTRNSQTPLNMLVLQAEGMTVTSQDNLTPEENCFTVNENGVYTFAVSGETRTEILSVVVDLFDNDPPDASITYSDTAPTKGAVLARLIPEESVRVKSLTVKYDGEEEEISQKPGLQFSFRKNGTATFTIMDEAGNENQFFATVSNLDSTPPNVKVVPYYAEGNTIGQGAAMVASKVTLAVEKQSQADEEFLVVNNGRKTTMEVTENGTYSFFVQDYVGNATQVSYTVNNIRSSIPSYSFQATYSDGTPVTGESWRNDDVTMKVIFEPITDGRKLYNGLVKTDTNELPMENGRFVLTRTFIGGGSTYAAVCDDLGNLARIPLNVAGIDTTAPTMTLERTTAVIDSGSIAPGEDLTSMLLGEPGRFRELFGDFTLSDNVFDPDALTVTVAQSGGGSDISKPGQYALRYTVSDPAGNVGYVAQALVVLPSDGLLIQADNILLSGSSSSTSILPDNEVTFAVDKDRMEAMFYGEQKETVHNSRMRYDIYYVGGLYREGQLKTIATQLTSEELTKQQFHVVFPEPGWYTIIIRNQERSREYTMFFVESMKK